VGLFKNKNYRLKHKRDLFSYSTYILYYAVKKILDSQILVNKFTQTISQKARILQFLVFQTILTSSQT